MLVSGIAVVLLPIIADADRVIARVDLDRPLEEAMRLDAGCVASLGVGAVPTLVGSLEVLAEQCVLARELEAVRERLWRQRDHGSWSTTWSERRALALLESVDPAGRCR